MLRENKFKSEGHLEAIEYDWGTLIRFVLPEALAPWEVWLDIEWPEVKPGRLVLLAGDGPDWFERELEDHYTPQASIVSHINPRVGMAPPHILKHIAADLIQARVQSILEHGAVVGRSRPKE